MKTAIIALIIGFVIFELIEHLLLPLFFSIKRRKNKSVCGVSGMIGKVVEVKEWKKNKGQVFVNGELWSAVCDRPMVPRSKAVIQNVKGLTLKVEPLVDHVPLKKLKANIEE